MKLLVAASSHAKKAKLYSEPVPILRKINYVMNNFNLVTRLLITLLYCLVGLRKRNSYSNNSTLSSFSWPRGDCGYLCGIEPSVYHSKGSLSYTHDYWLAGHPCAWGRWCWVPCGRGGGRRLESMLGIEASEGGDVDGKEQFEGWLENTTKERTEGPMKNKWKIKLKITIPRGITERKW